MFILIDSREKTRAIKKITEFFDTNGIQYASSKLFAGDYQIASNGSVVVDRKQNLNELCNNVCQDHKRFTNELKRCNDAGIKIYILVEHSKNINCLDDVRFWINPRSKVSPLAVSGERLHKILTTMEDHYGCKFVFCDKNHTAEYIIKILNGDEIK